MPLPESRREIEELLAEAKYYLVQGLLEECQAALQVGTLLSAYPPLLEPQVHRQEGQSQVRLPRCVQRSSGSPLCGNGSFGSLSTDLRGSARRTCLRVLSFRV